MSIPATSKRHIDGEEKPEPKGGRHDELSRAEHETRYTAPICCPAAAYRRNGAQRSATNESESTRYNRARNCSKGTGRKRNRVASDARGRCRRAASDENLWSAAARLHPRQIGRSGKRPYGGLSARRRNRTGYRSPRFSRASRWAVSSASAAATLTSGSTPTPSQFVFEIGLIARANGTPIMK